MTNEKRLHGLPVIACSICTRPNASMFPWEILAFLNDVQIRATYGAVATLIGTAGSDESPPSG